jgi:hypothetical protein
LQAFANLAYLFKEPAFSLMARGMVFFCVYFLDFSKLAMTQH